MTDAEVADVERALERGEDVSPDILLRLVRHAVKLGKRLEMVEGLILERH